MIVSWPVYQQKVQIFKPKVGKALFTRVDRIIVCLVVRPDFARDEEAGPVKALIGESGCDAASYTFFVLVEGCAVNVAHAGIDRRSYTVFRIVSVN